ncbi:MAG: hypothetical protein IJ343_10975 [Clostridia bacterium]|nr:hypothetical protein [Clostridia bacterium]
MNENERSQEEPVQTIDAPTDELWENDDWIGEMENRVKAFREEMADVAREADESLIDGPLGKALVFLKRHWRVVLTSVLLPLAMWGYDYYLHDTDFPVNDAIITESEFREIIDGVAYLEMDGGYFDTHPAVEYQVSLRYDWDMLDLMDLDGDGAGDTEAFVLATHGYKARGYRVNAQGETVYFEELREPLPIGTDSHIMRASVWDVLSGTCGWGVRQAGAGMFDHTGDVYVTVINPGENIQKEIRAVVEELLAAIRQARADEAAGLIPPVQHGPKEVAPPTEVVTEVINLLRTGEE